jgi:hypothetical protein
MIVVPPPAPHVNRRRRTLSIWIGAIIVSACVAAAATVALSTLHPVKRPAEVGKAYLEARYAGNWSEAWALECELTRSFVGDYERFGMSAAHWDEYLSLPRHVEVEVGDDLHDVGEPGGFTTVTATVTSAERRDWSITGELPLVVKDGQFQVCDGGRGLA